MKKAVATLLFISILGLLFQPFTLSYQAVAEERPPSFKRGLKNGKKDANRDTKIGWSLLDFTYGFIVGPVAVGHSLLSDYVLKLTELPDRRKRQIDNRSQAYQEGYKRGYFGTKGRNKLAIRATGWIGWIGTWAVLDQMKE